MTTTTRRTAALLLLTLLLGGCAVFDDAPGSTLEETGAELRAIVAGAVEAADLPVTREAPAPGLTLDCTDGQRLTHKVNADDPPQLEPYADAVVAHLQAEGWELASTQDFGGDAGPSQSRFLLRDGFEVIVDVVRGTEGTGVDIEVLSPCRTFE